MTFAQTVLMIVQTVLMTDLKNWPVVLTDLTIGIDHFEMKDLQSRIAPMIWGTGWKPDLEMNPSLEWNPSLEIWELIHRKTFRYLTLPRETGNVFEIEILQVIVILLTRDRVSKRASQQVAILDQIWSEKQIRILDWRVRPIESNDIVTFFIKFHISRRSEKSTTKATWMANQ